MKESKTQKKTPRQRGEKYSKCTKEMEERIDINEQENDREAKEGKSSIHLCRVSKEGVKLLEKIES